MEIAPWGRFFKIKIRIRLFWTNLHESRIFRWYCWGVCMGWVCLGLWHVVQAEVKIRAGWNNFRSASHNGRGNKLAKMGFRADAYQRQAPINFGLPDYFRGTYFNYHEVWSWKDKFQQSLHRPHYITVMISSSAFNLKDNVPSSARINVDSCLNKLFYWGVS